MNSPQVLEILKDSERRKFHSAVAKGLAIRLRIPPQEDWLASLLDMRDYQSNHLALRQWVSENWPDDLPHDVGAATKELETTLETQLNAIFCR